MPAVSRRTVVLVDGENIDATLAGSILNHRPEPSERPRWDRIVEFARGLGNGEVTALFFLNATNGYLPWPFISALQGIGFTPIPLAGGPGEKVVDLGIQRTLDALVGRDSDVLLASHDRDFVPHVERLLAAGHRVDLLGFREQVSGAYAALDVQVHDLEFDVHAFTVHLGRVRVIPLAEFDPETFLV